MCVLLLHCLLFARFFKRKSNKQNSNKKRTLNIDLPRTASRRSDREIVSGLSLKRLPSVVCYVCKQDRSAVHVSFWRVLYFTSAVIPYVLCLLPVGSELLLHLLL